MDRNPGFVPPDRKLAPHYAKTPKAFWLHTGYERLGSRRLRRAAIIQSGQNECCRLDEG